MLFAATRFIVAGVLLSAFAWRTAGWPVLGKGDVGRLVVASLLMIALCYGPLFSGMRYVASGTAAVLEMSLTPLALLGFGIALGEERWSWIGAAAMGLGVVGLGILFAPSVAGTDLLGVSSALGLAAVAWAALSSAWGSVLARSLIARHGSAALAGATTLIGGAVLLLASLATEPGAASALTTFWGWPAIAGWLFLVVAGSLVGYSIYMQLLRDIGPAKAGSFAFVSPAIAVALGIAFAGETATAQDFLGMLVMLLAAGACLYGDKLEALTYSCDPRQSHRGCTSSTL